MNAILSIENKTFIVDLESFLLSNKTAENTSFKEFCSMVWDLICLLNQKFKKQYSKLCSQLGLKKIPSNIGNIQYKILEKLGLSSYL